jgi:hypothetical protein
VLDAYIIDQIRKRDDKRDDDRPVLELPLPTERRPSQDRNPDTYDDADNPNDEDEPSEDSPDDRRGVVIIDFLGHSR